MRAKALGVWGAVGAPGADDPVARRHHPGHGEMEQAGQQFAFRQITGRAEQDQHVVIGDVRTVRQQRQRRGGGRILTPLPGRRRVHGRRIRRSRIDVDHLAEVRGDPLHRRGPVEAAGDVLAQRIEPDGPADRETDIATHRGRGLQPARDAVEVGAAAQDDAGHVLASVRAGLRDRPFAVGAIVQAFDLPDVRLDAGVLEFGDRADDQRWS